MRLKTLIVSALATLILLPGVSNTAAEAHDKHKGRSVIVVQPLYPTYSPFYRPYWEPFGWPNYTVVDPVAEMRDWGYREGRHEGKDDAKDRLVPDPTRSEDYYKSGSSIYHQAFIRGYYDGYDHEIRD